MRHMNLILKVGEKQFRNIMWSLVLTLYINIYIYIYIYTHKFCVMPIKTIIGTSLKLNYITRRQDFNIEKSISSNPLSTNMNACDRFRKFV